MSFVTTLFFASCGIAFFADKTCRGGRRRVSLMILASGLFFSSLFLCGQALRNSGHITDGRSEYAAEIQSDAKSLSVRIGDIVTIPLFVSNRGSVRWSSDAKDNPFFLSWHILSSGGEMLRYENPRIAFASAWKPRYRMFASEDMTRRAQSSVWEKKLL